MWRGIRPQAYWGFRSNVNAVPEGIRTVFRDDSEHRSGMKVNTDSAMKPNSFRPIPEPRKPNSAQRVEAASERALLTGACRYKSVESILKNSLDRVPPSSPPPTPTPPHDNIRGSEYFE